MPTLFCMKSGARSHASLCTAASAFEHDKSENVQCPALSATIYMATSRKVDVLAIGMRHLYAASSQLEAKHRCSQTAYQRSWCGAVQGSAAQSR